MFDLIDASVRFDNLYKSGNEDDYALSQKLCQTVQDKMLKYNVSYGNMSLLYPNMEEFTVNPKSWKEFETPYMVGSLEDVTVEYDK